MKVMSPKEFLGFTPGDDRKLANWDEIIRYFKQLTQKSKRMKWFDMGRTTEGRSFFYVSISSPDNIRNLDKLREIHARLADPRGLSEEEAKCLVSQSKTIVMISCSIHATEVGAAQMSMELAHDLEISQDPETLAILDNVILLLVPSLNPDGLDLVVDWYKKYLGTPYEGCQPPFLYQKYSGHDNNRDWFMLNLVENRLAVHKLHHVWHPQIVFDMHQMGATGFRFFVPPYVDPYDPNIDFILRQEINMLGTHMVGELLSAGKTGVSFYNSFDAYAPARAYQHYHGGIRILSEAASVKLATPITVTKAMLVASRDGWDTKESTWNHPVPWSGGLWRLRDIVDYEKITAMACLAHAAKFRHLWVSNFYKLGLRACERQKPFAFVLPKDQRDPVMLYELLKVLHMGQVEIHEAQEDFELQGAVFHKGSFVVKLAQPYGAYAKTLLEIQEYPDLRQYPGGPPKLPYDITGHTLPLLMGVRWTLAEEPFDVVLKKIDEPCLPLGGTQQARLKQTNTASPRGGWQVLSPALNSSCKVVNGILNEGGVVYRTKKNHDKSAGHLAPGSYLIPWDTKGVHELCQRFGVEAFFIDNFKGPKYKLRRPKVAVYQPFWPVADEGWLRYVLEEYDFPYMSIDKNRVRRGGLWEEFDTIIFPSIWPRLIKDGNPAKEYPPEYSGGLGAEGREAIALFTERGGTSVFADASCAWAVEELGLPVTNVLEGKEAPEFFAPGSVLKTIVDTCHPLGFGLLRETAVMFSRSPAWDTVLGTVVARYPAADPLMSGWLLGGELLSNKASLLEIPIGCGRVVLVGFHPHFRAQARGTYKVMFNSIYLGSAEEA